MRPSPPAHPLVTPTGRIGLAGVLALLALPGVTSLAPHAALAAQTPALTVRLAHDSEAERVTRDQLLELAARYDLSPWVRTTEILIDEEQIPHSHPVLTLHTRYIGDDYGLVAVFLHEQLHWVAIEKDEATERAIARFQEMFPDLPAAADGGARDDRSTLLHLVVCDLELAAATAVLGEETARRVLGANTHYQWIYGHVLGNPAVRQVTTEAGLFR
jgi:hypothetical protein